MPDRSSPTPVRVRRIRSVVAPVRVRRIRSVTASPSTDELPRYEVDFDKEWGSLLQLYLMASYLYYHAARSIITDHDYDRLCQVLLAGWARGKHPHKHLISVHDLRAGTGYSIKYPTIVRVSAWIMLENFREC